MSGRRAVFLDRDGTIIRDTNYIARPEDVELLAGAAPAIRRLNHAGLPVILVTNQSGIARGLITDLEYRAVHSRLLELLREQGAALSAAYYCPHAPDETGTPTCECRKPGTLLFRRAAAEHDIELDRSVFAGDRWRDVAPAVVLGGMGVLVAGDPTSPEDRRHAAVGQAHIVSSLGGLADLVLGES